MKNPDFSKYLRGYEALPRRCFVLLAAMMLFAGCASTNNVVDARPAKEIYDFAMDSYLHEKQEDAEKGFKTLMEEHPLSKYALEAELMLGDVCFAGDKYDEAGSYYTNFVAMHPAHSRASYALFQKGMSYFKDVLSVDRDQTATRKALFAFEDLVVNYPDSPYKDRAKELIAFARRRLAEREFYVGRFYFKGKNYKGALGRFRDILKNYSDTGLTDEALYFIGQSYAKLGEGALAQDAFNTLIKNFPDSRFVADAKGQIKES